MPPKKKVQTPSFRVKRDYDYILKNHIQYLKTMCRLWPSMVELQRALKDNNVKKISAIKLKQAPIIKKAFSYQSETMKWRIANIEAYDKDEAFRFEEDLKNKHDPVRFINIYCWTVDPRLPEGLSKELPLILWPKQEEFINFVNECYNSSASWILEKSRGWGATWLLSAYQVWHWVYTKNFSGAFGSREKEAVDRLGDMDTIFAKVRHIIYRLPNLMRTESYRHKTTSEPSKHDNVMRIYNPRTDSIIIGQGGDQMGRGGRKSIYIIDEKAFVQHPDKVDRAVSGTTRCQGDISTICGMNHFGKKRHSGRLPVFTAHWYDDPSKNPKWPDPRTNDIEETPYLQYEFDRIGGDKVGMAQELFIDYNASVEDAFIPSEWVQACVNFDLSPDGTKASGFDVAGHGDNKSTYISRSGPVVNMPKVLHYDNSTESALEAMELAEKDGVDIFSYDQDGLGDSVYGLFKITEAKPYVINGVFGNSNPPENVYDYERGKFVKEIYRNRRAYNWSIFRDRVRRTYEHCNNIRYYDESEMVSLPNDPDLISQISQPKRVRGLGGSTKIQVESKLEMRTRGVDSPDGADAVVLSFADPDDEAKVMTHFDTRKDRSNIVDFTIDWENPVGETIVSMVQGEGLEMYVLMAVWYPWKPYPKLRVFDEIHEQSPQPEKLVDLIRERCCSHIAPINYWIGNDAMFESKEKGATASYWFYWKQKIKLRRNYTNDYKSSIIIVNQLFANKIAEIHPNSERVWMQLNGWRLDHHNRPDPRLGFAMALCQIATMLKQKKKIINRQLQPGERAEKNAYNGSVGRFTRKVKKDSKIPTYMKTAERHVLAYGKPKEIEIFE